MKISLETLREHIRVVPSAYLRLLIFLPVILISACASSSLAFHMMYSACKLNKQGGIQPWHALSPVWNQLVVLHLVLTFFLTCIQISQKAGHLDQRSANDGLQAILTHCLFCNYSFIVKFYYRISPICLRIYGCSPASVAKLSSYNRDHIIHKA